MRIGNTNTFTNMMTSSSYGAYSTPPPSYSPRSSPWHSPVPYLFAGLAAMLGLIAFALLILACSYWKLSGYLEDENTTREESRNGEDENVKGENDHKIFEEKFLVIMAGEVKPTHLATASTSRTSSFGSEQQSEKATAKAEVEGGLDRCTVHDR